MTRLLMIIKIRVNYYLLENKLTFLEFENRTA